MTPAARALARIDAIVARRDALGAMPDDAALAIVYQSPSIPGAEAVVRLPDGSAGPLLDVARAAVARAEAWDRLAATGDDNNEAEWGAWGEADFAFDQSVAALIAALAGDPGDPA